MIQERFLGEEPWRQVRMSEVRKAGGAAVQRDRLRGMREHGMLGNLAVFPGT